MARSFKKRDTRHSYEDGNIRKVKKESRSKLNHYLKNIDIKYTDKDDEREFLYGSYGKG